MGYERHCGSGFELVLDVTVPQLVRELVEVPNVVSLVVEQNVHIPVRGGGRSKIPRGGVQGLETGKGPRFQFFSPRAGSVSITCASGGLHLSRAGSVSTACASGGVHLTRASSVSSDSASGGVHFTRASSVSGDSASDRVHFTRASRVPGDSASVEYFSPVPAVFPATAPVVEYFSPAPAVFPVTAPVVEYFSPAPAASQASSSAVAGGDSQGSVPGQSSTVRGGAVARGRGLQGPVPPLIAELFSLGELPPEARTPSCPSKDEGDCCLAGWRRVRTTSWRGVPGVSVTCSYISLRCLRCSHFFLRPLVSDSHLFDAGLPEEHRYAVFRGVDFRKCRINRFLVR